MLKKYINCMAQFGKSIGELKHTVTKVLEVKQTHDYRFKIVHIMWELEKRSVRLSSYILFQAAVFFWNILHSSKQLNMFMLKSFFCVTWTTFILQV